MYPSGSVKARNVIQIHKINASDDPEPKERRRKIVRYDNMGDPVYEGDELDQGIKVFGFNIGFRPDAVTSTFLLFAVIAFNFFVVANADLFF